MVEINNFKDLFLEKVIMDGEWIWIIAIKLTVIELASTVMTCLQHTLLAITPTLHFIVEI
jgi:hypothetical protein